MSAHRYQRSLMPNTGGDVDSDRTRAKRSRKPTSATEDDVAIVLNIQKQESWVTDISRGSSTRIISNLLGQSTHVTE